MPSGRKPVGNPSARTAYMRQWRAKNAEKNAAYQKAYRLEYSASHRDEANARSHAWYTANRDHAIALTKARYHANKALKGRPRGEQHHAWKGEGVSYDALHRWVMRWKGNPSLCERCGRTDAKKYEWANVNHKYQRVLEDWQRLCTSCHRKHDYEKGLSAKGGPAKSGEWKSESAGYKAIHAWVRRHKARPIHCEQCGTESAKRYEWSNIDGTYRRDLSDYINLCHSCHVKHDYRLGVVKKGERHRRRSDTKPNAIDRLRLERNSPK